MEFGLDSISERGEVIKTGNVPEYAKLTCLVPYNSDVFLPS